MSWTSNFCYSSVRPSCLQVNPHWALSMGMSCIALISPRSRIIISTRPKTYQHTAVCFLTVISLCVVTSHQQIQERVKKLFSSHIPSPATLHVHWLTAWIDSEVAVIQGTLLSQKRLWTVHGWPIYVILRWPRVIILLDIQNDRLLSVLQFL